MKIPGGYILLHRQIIDHPLYFAEPFSRIMAWIDLLLLANHATGYIYVRGNRIEVNRGQVGLSEDTLAQRWKWSRGKVRRFLNELENDQQIVQQKSRVKSLISVVNYDKYQLGSTTDSTTDGQQTDTNNKNKKNNKNIEGVPLPSPQRKKKMFTPPSLDEVKAYATTRGRTDLTKRFFDYYHAGDWKDGNGKPVKNWKQKFITWENSPKAETQHKNQNQLDLTGRW